MTSPVTHLNRLRSRVSRSSFQLRSLCVIRKEEDPFKNVYLIRLEIFECPWTLFPPSISNRIVFCVRGRLPHIVEHIQHFPCRLCFQNSSFFFFVESSPVIYNWTKKLKGRDTLFPVITMSIRLSIAFLRPYFITGNFMLS